MSEAACEAYNRVRPPTMLHDRQRSGRVHCVGHNGYTHTPQELLALRRRPTTLKATLKRCRRRGHELYKTPFALPSSSLPDSETWLLFISYFCARLSRKEGGISVSRSNRATFALKHLTAASVHNSSWTAVAMVPSFLHNPVHETPVYNSMV